jgi:hypothetical protein
MTIPQLEIRIQRSHIQMVVHANIGLSDEQHHNYKGPWLAQKR